MAAEAEAAREARAKVIAAEGEHRASRSLRHAAEVIMDSPAALQLRYLQTLNSISAENNSTVIFPVPIDILNTFMQCSTNNNQDQFLRQQYYQAQMQNYLQQQQQQQQQPGQQQQQQPHVLIPMNVPPAPNKPPPPVPGAKPGHAKLQNQKLTSKGSSGRLTPEEEESEKQNMIEEVEFEMPELEFP